MTAKSQRKARRQQASRRLSLSRTVFARQRINWRCDPYQIQITAQEIRAQAKLSREQSNNLIYSTIFRASTQAISDEQITALMILFRAQIDALRQSKLDLNGWTSLNEMNLFSFERGQPLFHATSNEEARRQIAPSQKTFEAACGRLYQTACATGKAIDLVAFGDDLKALMDL